MSNNYSFKAAAKSLPAWGKTITRPIFAQEAAVASYQNLHAPQIPYAPSIQQQDFAAFQQFYHSQHAQHHVPQPFHHPHLAYHTPMTPTASVSSTAHFIHKQTRFIQPTAVVSKPLHQHVEAEQFPPLPQSFQQHHRLQQQHIQQQEQPKNKNHLYGARLYKTSTPTNTKQNNARQNNKILNVAPILQNQTKSNVLKPQTRSLHTDIPKSSQIPVDLKKMFPESPAASTTSGSDKEGLAGIIVEYIHDMGEKRLGVVTGPVSYAVSNKIVPAQKWRLITEDGEKEVESSKLTYKWPVEYDHSKDNFQETEKEVNTMVERAQPKIEDLWKTLLNSKKSISITYTDVAEYLFKIQTPYALYASHKLLTNNSLYFKPAANNHFECRSVREVEELLLKDDGQREIIIGEKLFIARVSHHLLHSCSLTESDRERFTNIKTKALSDANNLQQKEVSLSLTFSTGDNEKLQQLKEFAIGQVRENPMSEYMKHLGFDTSANAAYRICRMLKMFTPTENIHFLRSAYSTTFPQELDELATKIRDESASYPDPDHKIRRDLSHLAVYAIDNIERTTEVDDAISIEVKEDGTEYVYIHIADPTRYIDFGSTVERAAFERVSSIYLPELKIPMLPPQLSEQLMSLSEDKANYVLAFGAKVMPNGELSECDIFPAKVGKIRRLDYDQLDQVFEHNASIDQKTYDNLQRLARIANIRLRYRVKRGAQLFNLPKPEVYVEKKVPTGAEAKVEVEASKDITSHSRRLVQELMIVANEISARFAHAHQISIPYRGTQGAFNPSSVGAIAEKEILSLNSNMTEAELSRLVLANHKSFKGTPSAYYSQTPSYHEGLGVDAYAQVTSPLRRYSDLLIHYQLKARLRGEEPPLSWESIQNMIFNVEFKTKSIQSLQKNSERFWLYKYFEQNKKKLFRALVLESTNDNFGLLHEYIATVFLYDVGLTTKAKAYRQLNVGDVTYLRVQEANAYTDTLKLEEAFHEELQAHSN